MPPSSRRQQLEALLANSPDDAFLLYGLAMEHFKEGNTAGGVQGLTDLIGKQPTYVAAYFQLGQKLSEAGDVPQAKRWLTEGITVAKKVGDTHAAVEMQGFLDIM